MSADNDGCKQRDFWDRLEGVSRILSAILLPLVLFVMGVWVNNTMEKQRQDETKSMEAQKQREEKHRLFSQIMSQRESADSALRKDMFQQIIQSVVGKKDDKMRVSDEILKLELLAQNFHDSIDLRALFYDVQRQLLSKSDEGKDDEQLKARLKSVAEEIRKRQFSVLEQGGNTADFTVDLTQVQDVNEGYGQPLVLSLEGKSAADGESPTSEYLMLGIGEKKERKFVRTQVLRKNEKTEELEVRLQIITRNEDKTVDLQGAEMWVGFYDFPMIDNIRLRNSDQRCAVVLNHFEKSDKSKKGDNSEKGLAKISVVVFPGCRASLKEKAYYEEYLARLQSVGPDKLPWASTSLEAK
ncbi:MAG: hypothetical protein HY913_20630 [Desulfomonile tiedjei]|nr:hypothetical protein [Desulfomonile tiedjei]